MEIVLTAVLALAAGVALGVWMNGRSRAGAEARSADAFARLATEALQRNSEQLAHLAEARLQTATERVAAESTQREERMKTIVAPLREKLDTLQTATQNLEKSREGAYADLKLRLDSLQQATLKLDQDSRALSNTLKGSAQAQGRWGEMVLRNVAELAHMTEHCDFEVQAVGVDKSRPDMVVHVPGGARIAVDAKAPLDAFSDGCNATDLKQQEEHFKRHANALAAHVKTLKQRDYAKLLGGHVDITVLFLPSDALLSAAWKSTPQLQEDALRNGILIATPVTLIALLRTVALYWTQHQLNEKAQEVVNEALELNDRLRIYAEHVASVGKGLRGAVDAYNDSVSSYQSRLLPKGQAIQKLSASTKKEPPSLSEIETLPRIPHRD
jgi:DNA recombination protein RmuC